MECSVCGRKYPDKRTRPSGMCGKCFARKMGKSTKGRKSRLSPEDEKIRRDKISKSKTGHLTSEETRKKISASKKGYKATIETRRKLAAWQSGEKSRFWKGGIHPVNKRIRNSLEYKLWRESVFKRDNWTCVWCGVRSSKGNPVILNADHIKQFAYYPELRFAIDNGRTLCFPCHKKTETYCNNKKP